MGSFRVSLVCVKASLSPVVTLIFGVSYLSWSGGVFPLNMVYFAARLPPPFLCFFFSAYFFSTSSSQTIMAFRFWTRDYSSCCLFFPLDLHRPSRELFGCFCRFVSVKSLRRSVLRNLYPREACLGMYFPKINTQCKNNCYQVYFFQKIIACSILSHTPRPPLPPALANPPRLDRFSPATLATLRPDRWSPSCQDPSPPGETAPWYKDLTITAANAFRSGGQNDSKIVCCYAFTRRPNM